MADRIVMPKLGLTMDTGVVTSWHKKEGDKIEKGEILFEVETDKIVNEIESPFSGTVLNILVNEGAEVKVQTLLAVVGQPGEDISDIISGGVPLQEKAEKPEKAEKEVAVSAPSSCEKSEVKITPRARKLIAKLGLDPSEFAGFGNKRVTEDDVKKFAGQKKVTGTADKDDIKKIPLSGMRKRIADKMTQSKQTAPHIYFRTCVDATAITALRANFPDKNDRPSFNDIIIKAAADALENLPDVNVSLINGEIVYHPQINIGLAVGLESGLIVPVIKNADKLSLAEVHRQTVALAQKTKAGVLSGDDVTGGTFTITNLGMYQIDEFTAIINPPESAILAIGRTQQKPFVHDGKIAVRPEMNLTLSVDHRVIDGLLAAKFLEKIKTQLESLDFVK